MTELKFFTPKSIAPTSGRFHRATIVDGKTVYLGGQVSVDMERNTVGVGDAAAQTKQIFANIEATLGELGGDLNNIALLTMYVVGRDSLAGVRDGKAEVLDEGRMTNEPPGTLVLVAGLSNEEWLLEVEGVAVLD
jgi:enamine deaminase RidA (YjgF/YER057c/UK114 family)